MKLDVAGREAAVPDDESQPIHLVAVLRSTARAQPDALAYTFLRDGEVEDSRLTYGELDRQACAIAARLQASSAPGQRAMLLYPPGLGFVTALLGCFYAGVVAVPTFPPRSRRADARLRGIAEDAEPSVILTDSSLLPAIRNQLAGADALPCLATDSLIPEEAEGWTAPLPEPDDPAFLQYTSGSTAAPKGVIVTYGNLLHNEEMIRTVCGHSAETVMVSWLPPYHDMGLIAGILQPLYVGGRGVLFSPIAFLQKPVRWLDAITRYRGTTSGGPNFAYDLCVRKVTAEDRQRLDLSSWRVAFNGAEPVRGETIERFARVFARCGFDRRASYPCYGLAEATLLVTGGKRDEEPLVEWFDPEALEQHRVAPVSGVRERILVSCGRPWSGQEVRIVDSETRQECRPDRIGEIWVAGRSVAQGYWGRPEATTRDFGGRLADNPETGPFLCTGDLGFLWNGELFVTGRLKDLIILRGRNHYPQDLELTAGQAHPQLRPGSGAAFSVEAEGEERLVVVHEVRRDLDDDQVAVGEVTDALRRAVAEEHEVHVWEVVLLPAGNLPKTSSGKVQRRLCRAAYQAGKLPVVGASSAADRRGGPPLPAPSPPPPSLTREEIRALAPEQRLEQMTAFLSHWLAQVVEAEPARLDPDRPLTALGLDSLRAIELSSVVEQRLGTGPSQARLLEGVTLREVAADLLSRLEEGAEQVAPGPAEVRTEDHPLSRGQRALWFLERLTPGTTAFLLSGALRIRGRLDRAALGRALGRLVARHPALRTTFREIAGEPRQVVHAMLPVELVEEDATAWSETRLRERLAATAYCPLDHQQGPLFRLGLFHRGEDEQVLLVTFHHLISDLWSIGLFLDELEAVYREETGGPSAELPELAVSYTDYVHWQEGLLASARAEELGTFWQKELGDELPPLDLPTDRVRPAVPTMRGAMATIRLDRDLLAAVEAVGERRGATVFMTLAAALQVLLHRYTARDEVVLGVPTTGRGAARLQGLIGYFVNPVVLRAELATDLSFDAFLDQTRQRVLTAFAHQEYPFPLLAERLQAQRDAAHAPIFQVMLVFQQARHPGLAAASLGDDGACLELFGRPCESLRLPCRDSQLDLTIYAAPWDDGLALALEYSTELFDATTVERLLSHFRVLLQGITAAAGDRLSQLPLLRAGERAQLLVEWNDTGADSVADGLHDLVTAQVRRTPKATAVICGRTGQALTYRQLERRSAALAARLRALGVGPEVRVGVCLPRTPDLVVALLGVLRAGGAYVPIDPEYPAERQAFMLSDSRARVLVSHRSLEDKLPAGPEILFLDQLPRRAPAGAAAGVDVDPRNLSHLIYTSGSTGVPKAVAIRHGAAVAMVRWSLERYRPEELRGVLLSTSVCFDISVYEIFVPLACGGSVIVADNALALPQLAVRDQVTLINTVPSAMTELVRQDAVPASVVTVNLAGEPLKRELVDGIYRRGSVDRVYNLYGPSEDTTYSTWVQVPRQGKVTIGRPLAGTRAYVLDRAHRPVALGVPGELCLAGQGLARGYLGRAALTSERFIPNPFAAQRGERLYRTGDLVRYLPSGEIDFLGRIDHQVKMRGFRIELGEIESALLAHESVQECVVVALEDAARGTVLVAYVVGAAERPEPDPLRAYLGQRLPEPMVPSVFAMLDKLPLLPNGKVDRRALPVPDFSTAERGYVPPRTPVEELLAGIWSEVLGVTGPDGRRVGVHERFFDLGGHSLLATQVLSRVRETFGVELPVRSLFETPELAALAARIESSTGAAVQPSPPPLDRVGREDPLPLSFAQQRLWFLSRLEPDSPYYNIATAGRLRGPLAVEPLRRAVGEIVHRHEALRTTFLQCSEEPVQVIARRLEPSLPVVDLTALAAAGREQVLSALLREEARRPFDLRRGPLLRVGLVRMNPEDHGVWLTMHHIVSDGWSLGVFFRELAVLYEAFSAGLPSPLPELGVQYADYACWQRRALNQEVLASELGYWREQLSGAPALLDLPADRPRPAVQSLRGATCELRLPAERVAALEGLSRQRGVTLFMTLMSAFQLLLSRVSGQNDVVVGFPVANRNQVEIEPLIGVFVNILVLRTDLAGNPKFSELLVRVRGEVLDAWTHQEVPVEKLVEELAPERNLAYTPLFQVVLGLQNAPWELPRLGGLEFQPRALETGTAKFDLTLLLEEREGSVVGRLEYCTALYDATTIRRLLGHFRNLLSAVTAEPDERVAALPLLSAGERAQLLVEWPDTRRAYPREATVPALFEAQAQRAPAAVAVVLGHQALSYGELNLRANRLAHHLRALGVGPEVPVAIFMERSVEMVVAILGVLKAGGFYLPLDIGSPPERLAFMLDDVGVGVLLARDHLLGALPEHAARVVCVDRHGPRIARCSGANPEPRGTAENLCYAMHTSGSTGRPKGVAVVHRGVVRLVRETNFAALGPDEVFLQFAPISFDASTLEIWGPLLNGGRMVVFPAHQPSLEELGEVVERHRVSTLWLTAGLFHQMAEGHLLPLRSVRQLLAGGDVLSVPHVRRVMRDLPSVRLINGYGPTENTTFTCCHPLVPADGKRPSVPIGRPIAQTGSYLVDRGARPVPIGVPGELWITGDGLARGYLARPALSAERFVPDPVGRGRAYRTGDLARALPDGRIEFLGRIDTQVKVRGFRIELGEIEVVLREHPVVRDAVVSLHGEAAGEKRLVAWVVGPEDRQAVPAELREFLRARLPEHMVPAAFMTLDELPLTPHGKVDRRALPAPEWEGEEVDYTPPRTPIEDLLTGVWTELFEVRRIGIHDDFFELGGHSLLATRAISRIRERLRVELPVRALFEAPTVAALASRIETLIGPATERSLPPLDRVARDGPVPASFAQQRLWFLDQLEPGSPYYNVAGAARLRGPLEVAALRRALGEIVRRHEALRTTFADRSGEPVQVVAPRVEVLVPVVELTALAPARREVLVTALLREEAQRPFDLSRGPLLRIGLVKMADSPDREEHRVWVTMHHIVGDGWSLGVFFRELTTLYEAFAAGRSAADPDIGLPDLPVQYADFACWQRRALGDQVLAAELNYWREELSGSPALLDLPTDRPRPPVQSLHGATCALRLSVEKVASLEDLSRRHGVTLYMTLLTAFQLLLGRYSGEDDVVVGSPVANRNGVEIEPLIGFFVNTLVLRTDLSGNPPFSELLARVRGGVLDAYAHQEVPFEKLVEELEPERQLAYTPLFQVVFALQSAPWEPPRLTGLEVVPEALETGTAKFDLTLSLEKREEGVTGALEYSTALFDATTMHRLLAHFRTLLDAIVAAPGQRLFQLPLLSAAERFQLIREWNDTAAADPIGDIDGWGCVHQAFERWAATTPAAVAVVGGGETLSYGELNRRANRVAHALRARGVGPEVVVAVVMDRSPWMVVAILGILKTGGAYLPIDPDTPPQRVGFMLEDSGAALLLTEQGRCDKLGEINVRMLCPDRGDLGPDSEENPVSEVGFWHLAYVIYTSGSTGMPKGTELGHGGLVNLVRWHRIAFGVTAADRATQLAGPGFDASVWELWPYLTAGASVHIPDPNVVSDPHPLVAWLAAEAITISFLPTPLAEAVLTASWPERLTLRTLLTGGDRLRLRPAPSLPFTLINNYGPTENTVVTTSAPVASEGAASGLPSIGRPLVNTRLYLLDPTLQPVPIGVVGELCIAGTGLARGYRQRASLTAERFIPDPFSDRGGRRLYRTGDLVRYRSDGAVDFLGRIDRQVKIRGFRIEPGEVEKVLVRHDGVREAVVLVHSRGPEVGGRHLRLVAFIVTVGAAPAVGELRDLLRRSLPEYMVPSALVVIEEIPLTPNGKIDRVALLARADREAPELAGEEYLAPRDEVESILAGIWADVLGCGRVSVHDSFFELGGHSLLATRVISRIRELFHLEIELRTIFEEPTLGGLAQRLGSAHGRARSQLPITPISRDGELPLSFAQQRLWFLARLHPQSAAYNMPAAVELRGELAVGLLEAGLAEVARRHEVLRARFPTVQGRPHLVITPPAPRMLPLVDLRRLAAGEREVELRRLAVAEAGRAFDLAAEPLLRVTLLRLAATEHVVLVNMHHIVTDGWSVSRFVKELADLYRAGSRGEPSPLIPLPIQYADFAAWQQRWLRGEALEAQLAFWKGRLGGALPALRLPMDSLLNANASAAGALESREPAPELVGRLRALSQQQGTTLFMTLLAAFKLLLGRYSGQEDVVVGFPIAGRTHTETEPLIGCFLNTLALRGDLAGNPTFSELLSRVREEVLAAWAHQDVPFEKVVEAVAPERDLSRNPIFDVLLNYVNVPPTHLEFAGLTARFLDLWEPESKFFFTLYVDDDGERLRLRLVYRRDLFTSARMACLLAQYETLLAQIVADPRRPISAYSLVTPELGSQIPDPARSLPTPSYPLLHEMFLAWSERAPQLEALRQRDRRLTYGELAEQATALAQQLVADGLEPGEVVAVLSPRCFGLIVSMLGVFLSGGVLLNLDPNLPAERQQVMVREARASRALLVGDEAPPGWLEEVKGLRKIAVAAGGWAPDPEIAPGWETTPLPEPDPDGPAYLFFTSGTTGVPKGVLGRRRGLAHFLHWQREAFRIGPGDRAAQLTALSFDVVLRDILTPLVSGATLCLPDDDELGPGRILPWLAREEVTVMHTVPSLARAWLNHLPPDITLPLRVVFFAGEPLTDELVRRWRGAFPSGEVVNLYGPTETTLAKCCYRVPAEPLPGVQPLGRPLPETQALVLGPEDQRCGISEPGEIVIRTPFRSLGYVNSPEENRKRFFRNPWREDDEDLLYRTGDRGRYRPDGLLEILGRLDHQVKVRGVRVELPEIESHLIRHPAVREVVVVDRRAEPDSAAVELVAYYVPHAGRTASVSELRIHLRQHLPEAMVPSAYVRLDRLPLNPNGKVDRGALPEITAARPELDTDYVVPQSALERTLAAVWQEILGVERVGVHDNFFDLGGHSLLLVEIQGKLAETLSREVPMVALFQHPTIHALAGYLGREEAVGPTFERSLGRAAARRESAQCHQHDVAIVGMAGRFPEARNVEEFWANLRDGIESIRPLSDEQLEAAGVPQSVRDDPAYVKAGAYLDDITTFDAPLFGLTPREAEILDPQQRLFLECSWHALEDAGCDPATFAGSIGVYAGVFMSTYLVHNLLPARERLRAIGEVALRHANEKDFLATRVSYKLNLRGPSLSVQTSCSTSLVATHLACQALLNRECDMALAGGVALRVPHRVGYLWQSGGVLSPDGHCRAFDAQAAGTIFGEGVGVVVLKRLADAQADGDRIYAVIKGSAINNDGAVKVGFTAPSVGGQAEVIAEALAVSGIDPQTIRYVETHGTATPLGDPIEITALTQVYRSHTAEKGRCAIGSVKTNVGHLGAAAGVTGLIKTALMLHHGWLPPSLGFSEPNPEIDFANSPFRVNTTSQPWENDGAPRRAGLSSFGMGGTNAHMILEEAPQVPSSGSARPCQLLVLSAATAEALEAMTTGLATHLREHPELEIADVAFTLQVGRTALPHRRALVCRDHPDAGAVLEGNHAERILSAIPITGPRPIAFLFPGQGAQYPGMTRELYAVEAAFREQIDRCCELVLPTLGCDLRDFLYPSTEGEQEAAQRLADTALTQPALFTVEYALAQLLKRWGLSPQAMVGHSIGEYVAACLAGVFSLADALAVVAERGRLMAQLPPGAMLGVTLSAAELEPRLTGTVALAAVNGPRMCTASGPLTEIEALAAELEAAGVPCRRLYTSHAFHSAMMDPILAPFAERLRAVELRAPSERYLSNLTGTWISAREATDPDYWVRHLRQPVRFADNLEHLLREPDLVLLEVGPGRTLSSLVALQEQGRERVVLPSVRHPRDAESDLAFLSRTLGRLWLAGVRVDWFGFHAGWQRHRVSLPPYPFERRRFWIDSRAPGQLLPGQRSDLADWFYLPLWKQSRLPRPATIGIDGDPAPAWLLLSDSLGLGSEMANRLRQRGGIVKTVLVGSEFGITAAGEYQIAPHRPDDYGALLRELDANGPRPTIVAHLWNLTSAGEPATAADLRERGFFSLLYLTQALEREGWNGPLRIGVVVNGLRRVTGDEEVCPEKATLLGPCRVIPEEYPGITCQSIDVPFPATGAAAMAERLIAELQSAAPEPVVAYRGATRWVRIFEPVRLVAKSGRRLRQQGVYLITGGLGRLGLAHAEYLAREVSARLVLLGRSDPPREEDSTARHAAAVRRLEELGAEVLVIRGDVADRDQTAAALVAARARFGTIHGVIHAAGVAGGGVIQQQSREIAEAVLAPKIDGCRVLADLLADEPLDFVVLFSSTTPIAGGFGGVDRCAADAFADAFAQSERFHPETFTTAIDWDLWDAVGSREEPAEGGVRAILPHEGVEAFARILADDLERVVVSPWDLGTLIRERRAAVTREAMEPLRPAEASSHPRPHLATAYAPPESDLERKLVAIWQEILGIEQIGIHDNFFELGGHSLLAAQVISRVREHLGVDLPVGAMFEAPEVAPLAARIESAGRTDEQLRMPPLGPMPRDADLPLSFAQQRLWFLEQLMPGSPVYNIPGAVRMAGPLDVAALAAALNEVVHRHEVLRTTFVESGGVPRQVIAPHLPLALPLVNLDHLDAAAGEAEVRRLARREVRRPFDLTRGPLLRVLLARLAPTEHIAVFTMHHIISDGWSLGVFARDLGKIYAGGDLPPLAVQYADFAIWQRQWLLDPDSGVTARQLDWWRGQLAGISGVLNLPTDRPRLPRQTLRGAHIPVRVPAALRRDLETLARARGATLFMVLLTGFYLLLHRTSGQDDLLVGTPAAGRNRKEIEDLIGFFVNTLVLRARVANDRVGELLDRVRDRTLGAYEHQDLPFEKLVAELDPERDLSRSPLFQVMITLQNAPLSVELPALTLSSVQVDSPSARFDLDLQLGETADGLQGTCAYNPDLFDATTIRRLGEHYTNLLAAMVRNSQRPVAELSMLSTGQRQQIRKEWNDSAKMWASAGQTLPERLERWARAAPDAVPVRFARSGEALSYAELNRRANQLAHHLRALGVGPEGLVGICMERSPELLTALFATLKAGGAYVPIDPSYPAERVRFLLEDIRSPNGRPPVVLTQERFADLVTTPLVHRVLCVDRDWQAVATAPADDPMGGPDPDTLAYVIYTSGSTGKPKGVQITHRALVNFLLAMAARPGLSSADTLLAVTTVSFDIAVLELYLPLIVGAKVTLVSREDAADGTRLAAWLAAVGATVMQATPATWRELVEAGWEGCEDLVLLSGGEALPAELAARLLPLGRALWNLYGPTETTVWSAVHRVRNDDREGPVCLGRPIANTSLYVLDRALAPVPVGVVGELVIGGDGLSRGYLHRPALTAERFVPDPFRDPQDRTGGRLYRTGDLVRTLPDGGLAFLGRIDHQVKVRGFRIELGEIETTLERHPAVAQAVVTVHDRGDRPVAYLVARGDRVVPSTSELRRFLRASLPEYMIPAAFVVLDAFPLTPSGKVNRRELPAPGDERPRLEHEYSAPETPTQEFLAGIWAEVLGVTKIGIHDNFFDLGGHSLLLVQVHRKLLEAVDREITLMDLFNYPTVDALAEFLARAQDSLLDAGKIRGRAATRRELVKRRTQARSRARRRASRGRST